MKVVVQNLQKRSKLASELVEQYQPDVLLAQEINWKSEPDDFKSLSAHYTSRQGYGTAIYSSSSITNVRKIESPHAEIGGCIQKKTTIGTVNNTIDFVSFHGYNGQPLKNVAYLCDHVRAVIEALDPTNVPSAVFAGDFNTWSQEHIDAIEGLLFQEGFSHACSWNYPGRALPLDHVYVRNVSVNHFEVYKNQSDHQGAVLDISVIQ